MIHLSRLVLNPRSKHAANDIRDPYQMHRTFARAFDWTAHGNGAARCLFRVEEESETDTFTGSVVLVQSLVKPDWSFLTASAYLLSAPRTVSGTLCLPQGARLAFRLRANPTTLHDGRRSPIVKDAERAAWMERKAGLHGFTAASVRIGLPSIYKFRTASGTPVTIQAVTYEGGLEVTDTERFTAALEHGIGSAKGFGCGLLTVARVRP